jgi:hypothetical protein
MMLMQRGTLNLIATKPSKAAVAPTPPPPPTNYRLQGIAAALGELARTHMEPDLAAMVLDSLGLTVNDLQAAGADPYDLEPLKTSSA